VYFNPSYKEVNLKSGRYDFILELSLGFLNWPFGLLLSKITSPLKFISSTIIPTTSLIEISSEVDNIIGSFSS